jgi:hypothetical protein
MDVDTHAAVHARLLSMGISSACQPGSLVDPDSCHHIFRKTGRVKLVLQLQYQRCSSCKTTWRCHVLQSDGRQSHVA